uniref:Uncharacterized protein n=1 Tax=Arundo donax TaxID=35708 RepID=A0A0A9EMB4_ARUDO
MFKDPASLCHSFQFQQRIIITGKDGANRYFPFCSEEHFYCLFQFSNCDLPSRSRNIVSETSLFCFLDMTRNTPALH